MISTTYSCGYASASDAVMGIKKFCDDKNPGFSCEDIWLYYFDGKIKETNAEDIPYFLKSANFPLSTGAQPITFGAWAFEKPISFGPFSVAAHCTYGGLPPACSELLPKLKNVQR